VLNDDFLLKYMPLAMLHHCLALIGTIGSHVSRQDFGADVGQQSNLLCTF